MDMDEDKKTICKLTLQGGYKNLRDAAQGKPPSVNSFTIEEIVKFVLTESTISLYFASAESLAKAVSQTGWNRCTHQDLYLIQADIHSERKTSRPNQYLCCYQSKGGKIKETYYFEWLIEEIMLS